jgi:Zn-dependent M28 family amino/carboxypeptidase
MRFSFLPAGFIEKRVIEKNAERTVRCLSVDLGERTIRKYENLERARRYIVESFRRGGVEPTEATYRAKGREVANVIAEIRGTEYPDRIIVIGAHYDTVEDTQGADDNATGIAAVLELFRLLSPYRFKRTARFAAFTLEEPPFFATAQMGSTVYATSCKRRKERIELMVNFEMVGYASRRCRQDYPANHDMKTYPVYGNYISVITLTSCKEAAFLWRKTYDSRPGARIYSYVGPSSVRGMELSDHMSFIRSGYPAIMISDTAFYRNKNYHTPEDRYETINFGFLSKTIYDSRATLEELLNR